MASPEIKEVYCLKLKKSAPGLVKPPYPGELGQKIYNHISQEAWGLWLQHQILLINENHLSLAEPATRKFLEQEMEKFLFGDGSSAPSGFVPLS